MLRSHAALRQCVSSVSRRPCSVSISTARPLFPPPAPWLIQSRPRSWFSRLLGTGFNSVRKSKRTTPRRKNTAKTSNTSTSSRNTKAFQNSITPGAERKNAIKHPDESSSSLSASQPHHDLDSFLKWCKRNNVNTESPSFIGTHYEYIVAKALKSYDFNLERRGGPNDQGIDLAGHWTLPGDSRQFKVLVQCKVSRPDAAVARELEGACSGGRLDWRGEDVMAWLASPKKATAPMLQTMERSSRPTGFICVTQRGRICQVKWNQAADDAGLSSVLRKVTYVSEDSQKPKPRITLQRTDREMSQQPEPPRMHWSSLVALVMMWIFIAVLFVAVVIGGAVYDNYSKRRGIELEQEFRNVLMSA